MANNDGFCQKAVKMEQKVGQRMASGHRAKNAINPYFTRYLALEISFRNEQVVSSILTTSSKKRALRKQCSFSVK